MPESQPILVGNIHIPLSTSYMKRSIIEWSRESVAQRVRERLVGVQPGGVTLEVVDERVRQIDNWWRVSVRPSHEPERWLAYSRALGELENELREKDQLDVIFATGMTAKEEQKAERYKEGVQAAEPRLPKMLRPTKVAALEIVRELNRPLA